MNKEFKRAPILHKHKKDFNRALSATTIVLKKNLLPTYLFLVLCQKESIPVLHISLINLKDKIGISKYEMWYLKTFFLSCLTNLLSFYSPVPYLYLGHSASSQNIFVEIAHKGSRYFYYFITQPVYPHLIPVHIWTMSSCFWCWWIGWQAYNHVNYFSLFS